MRVSVAMMNRTPADRLHPRPLRAVYDRIELPPIRPVVTQVRLHGGMCRHCRHAFMAPTLAGQEPGSPFGPPIEVLAVYLRYHPAIGFELGLSAVPGGPDDQRVNVAAGSR